MSSESWHFKHRNLYHRAAHSSMSMLLKHLITADDDCSNLSMAGFSKSHLDGTWHNNFLPHLKNTCSWPLPSADLRKQLNTFNTINCQHPIYLFHIAFEHIAYHVSSAVYIYQQLFFFVEQMVYWVYHDIIHICIISHEC